MNNRTIILSLDGCNVSHEKDTLAESYGLVDERINDILSEIIERSPERVSIYLERIMDNSSTLNEAIVCAFLLGNKMRNLDDWHKERKNAIKRSEEDKAD